jgi:hypothetical protein
MTASPTAARAAVLLLVATAVLLPGSCGEQGGEQPAPKPPSELAGIAAEADRWATRAETLSQRPWAATLEFPKRLHLRIQALRAFVQEAAAARGAAPPALVERGRALVAGAPAFDQALALLERATPTLDRVNGHGHFIEAHMPPLETEGEAPFRIRVNQMKEQAALGVGYLDRALAGILDGAPDAQVHENIAMAQLRQVGDTSARLKEEVAQAAALAIAVGDRAKLLRNRISWAEGVVAKAGDAVPAEARQALEDARALAAGPLDGEGATVLEKLRNAQPDAAAKAGDLARRVEAAMERLTTAYLELGRKAGMPDPD